MILHQAGYTEEQGCVVYVRQRSGLQLLSWSSVPGQDPLSCMHAKIPKGKMDISLHYLALSGTVSVYFQKDKCLRFSIVSIHVAIKRDWN